MSNEEVKSFQVLEQHIVFKDNNWHILFLCKDDKYFISEYGYRFGIKPISEPNALKLISVTNR